MALSGAAYPRVATALYELLSTDATLESAVSDLAARLNTGAAQDAWPRMIRQEVNPGDPLQGVCIVFNAQAPAEADVRFCGDTDSATYLVSVKAVCPGNSIAALSEIVDRIAVLTFNVTTTTGLYTVRFEQSGEFAFGDDSGGRTYQHLGYVLAARVHLT